MCLLSFTLSILCVCIVRVSSPSVSKETRPAHDREVVCYVASWAVYRQGKGKFTIEDIDPSLCTRLIYAFTGLDTASSTIRVLDPNNDLEENHGKGSYKRMTALKKKYPHLTVSVAIGGWNEGSEKYSRLAADPRKRRVFIDSVVRFMRKYDFNGFNLDWEYPTKRGGAPKDKDNFVTLVKELRDALKPNGWSLTAALGAGKDTMETCYNLKELNKYLDHVYLMCYNYHGLWDGKTGANAPLHSADPYDVNTVQFSVDYMIRHGIDPRKLVMGVPMYGRTFIVQNERQGGELGAPTTGGAFSGPYTQEAGTMGYNEICAELHQPGFPWKRMWDEATLTPFAKSGSKIIAYDDKVSLKYKARFAVEKQLGGVMVWSIDTDDFRGECAYREGHPKGARRFQLLRAINEAIAISEKENVKNVTTPNTSTFIEAFTFILLLWVPIVLH